MRERVAGRSLQHAFAWIAFAALANAQTVTTVTTFTAPDGSRFVLAPDASTPLVHWAIATPADDPTRFPGLALATMRASLGGTWTAGSVDAAGERRALDDLDTAFHEWLAQPGDATRIEQLQTRKQEADRLCDREGFRRVLAGLPAHRPEVLDRSPFCLFLLTTVAEALPEVARTMVERREQQALRDLQPTWAETSFARDSALAGDAATALRAEVLALAIPDHPHGRLLERATLVAPRRAEAFATWNATQRPERSVHVLLGGFDPGAVRAEIERAFASTSLPAAAAPPVPTPRAITSLRRSAVSGVRVPTLAIAFVLPSDVQPRVLEATARWLGDGADSRVGQELAKLDRKNTTVRCIAPWPRTVGGRALLLLEVEDPAGVETLVDPLLKVCRQAGAAAPAATSVQTVLAAMERDRTNAANDPRQFAADLAVAAAMWPDRDPGDLLGTVIEAAAIQQLAKTLFAGQPVVVEGRP